MILDNEMILSNAQAVTSVGDTASTNQIDFGRNGAGYNKKVFVSVNTTATSGGSATLVATVQCDTDVAFGSPTNLFATSAVAVANLTAGTKLLEFTMPAEVERYVRVLYTVGTAALTAGKFNAFVDDVQQTNMTII